MVGRLVEEQRVGLGDPDAGDQHQPLPAAAEFRDQSVAQLLGRLELVEHDTDAPAVGLARLGRQRVEDRLAAASARRSDAGTSCST